jgi:site-specific recombinase XerD
MYTVFAKKDFPYGGGYIDIPLVIDEKNDEPVNVVCGFLISTAIKQGKRSSNTLISYASNLKLFFEVINSNLIEWHQVTDKQMANYLYGYLYKQRKLKGNSIAAHISALKRFYEWAYQVGLLFEPKEYSFGYQYDDFQDHIYMQSADISLISQYIEKEDFEEILGCTHSHVENPSMYVIERDEIVLMLGYYCGLRAAEVVDVRNFNTSKLRKAIDRAKTNNEMTVVLPIIGKGEKSRDVIFPPELFNKVDAFLRGGRKGLPNGSMIASSSGSQIKNKSHASTVLSNAKNNCDSYKGENLSSIHFHSLRHTFATNLVTWCYENNKDYRVLVPERMGHSDPQITEIYIWHEAVRNSRQEVLEKLNINKIENKRYKHHVDSEGK